MKRIVACMLVLLLLLTACQPSAEIPSDGGQTGPSQQETTTDPSQQETTADPSQQETTEAPTDPVDLPESDLSADICLLTERQTMSYEEFFGEDHMYVGINPFGRTDWAVPSDEGSTIFEAWWDLDDNGVCISSDAYEGKYYIPDSAAYSYRSGDSILSADGMYIYFQNTEEIVQVDMRTGDARRIVQCDYISDASICGRDALYYAAVTDGKFAVNRLYIPTMQLDVLYDDFPDNTPVGPREFYLYAPKSTQGDVVWQTINPEMLAQMKKELEDPNSKYRKSPSWDIDIADLWEQEDPWAQKNEAFLNVTLRLALCERIQEDTGIRAYLEGTCNQSSGSYTERLGIIDHCWNGSDPGHDHYSPEITEKAPMVLSLGQWMAIPDMVLAGEQDSISVELYSDRFMPWGLYVCENGKLMKKLIDVPVLSVISDDDHVYCVTQENVLLQVSNDGSVCNTLYNANDQIGELACYNGRLYFLDGDTLIELDVTEGKYRTLLEDPDITRMYIEEENDALYIEVKVGLFVGGYLYRITAEELEKNHYRL